MSRHARVEVDLDAIGANVSLLRSITPDSAFCAVVKADAYGHGAEQVAPVVLEAGADVLGVALVSEGAALRGAGIDAPILLLSEPPVDELAEAWNLGLTPTLYHRDTLEAASAVVGESGRWGVHIKVDTGMHRVGAAPEGALDLAAMTLTSPKLVLEGVYTHLAVADETDSGFTAGQLKALEEVLGDLRRHGIDPGMIHAANSAGLIAHPAARLDMVRCGIALYGITPAPGVGADLGLKPAMRVSSEVSRIAVVRAGEALSYGLRHTFDSDRLVATVPVGYADGMTRRLGETGGEVLVRGRRRPVRGVITMDQFMVELGPPDSEEARSVERGDEVVMLGSQTHPGGTDSDEIDAWEWALRIHTIAYEVVCAFSPRMPRIYRHG